MNKVTPTRTIRVGAREANQEFSKLLREVEAGAEVIISRNGREIARFCRTGPDVTQAERQRVIDDVLAFTDAHAKDRGGYRFKRDDAYEEFNERFDRR